MISGAYLKAGIIGGYKFLYFLRFMKLAVVNFSDFELVCH